LPWSLPRRAFQSCGHPASAGARHRKPSAIGNNGVICMDPRPLGERPSWSIVATRQRCAGHDSAVPGCAAAPGTSWRRVRRGPAPRRRPSRRPRFPQC
jgi:hypothetical protein